MEIKIGKKLWVKQDFIIDEADISAYKHKMGYMCIITGIYNVTVRYPVCVEFGGKKEFYSYAEIQQYFYDKVEWREQQINSILDDN
jgi:hypothetical protein